VNTEIDIGQQAKHNSDISGQGSKKLKEGKTNIIHRKASANTYLKEVVKKNLQE